MKIVKLITFALSLSVLVTAAAAVLNTLSEHGKTNDSVAVMANSGGDNMESINKTTGSISSLITEVLHSLPVQISKPVLSVLDCVYVGSKQITNLVLSFILPS